MEKRAIGSSDIQVVPLMLGGNVFGWTADAPTSFAVLDAFADAGLNFIDTADAYSAWVPGNQGGESETLIGKWLSAKGGRDKVVIATKVAKLASRPGLSAANIALAVEDSLRRLQTDYIDVYFSHHDDTEVPLEETLCAYDTLVRDGKVRVIGASNYSAERMTEALDISTRAGLPVYQIIQPMYNLIDRAEYEQSLAPFVARHHVAVVPFYSLANGFLSGKYRSVDDLTKSRRGERVRKYLNERGLQILGALDAVAEAHRATPASVALSWLMAQPGITAPIASATSVEQVQALASAVHLTLSRDELAALDAASA